MADDSTTLLHPAAHAARVRAVREFSIVHDAQTYGPFTDRSTVGTAASNDIVLDDKTVSRFHFEVRHSDRGLVVNDVGSTNGTYVGDVRIVSAFVKNGAVIRAGDSEVVVAIAAAPKLVESTVRSSFGGLIGSSDAMQSLFRILGRLAAVDTPVLVEGETGSGKELVARALHEEGRRKAGPFVVFDCSAVAPTLVESELFGYVPGAFTGADGSRAGAFEQASGGTLMLDELGELPTALQPKLLRALEAKTVRRLGDDHERSVDVRVVAATNRDLRRMVNEGRFREDLFHRLAVFTVAVPPLRERPDDIEPLARHFLARLLEGADFDHADTVSITASSIARLGARRWSGNVRELRNVIERAVVLGDLEAATKGDLATGFLEPGAATLEDAKKRFERAYLVGLLARHGGDRAAAAEEADVHPKSLGRMLRRLGLVHQRQS